MKHFYPDGDPNFLQDVDDDSPLAFESIMEW